jgi:hypothetical protein
MDIGKPRAERYEMPSRLRQKSSCHETIRVALNDTGQPENGHRSDAARIDHPLREAVNPKGLLPLLSWSAVPSRSVVSSGSGRFGCESSDRLPADGFDGCRDSK